MAYSTNLASVHKKIGERLQVIFVEYVGTELL